MKELCIQTIAIEKFNFAGTTSKIVASPKLTVQDEDGRIIA